MEVEINGIGNNKHVYLSSYLFNFQYEHLDGLINEMIDMNPDRTTSLPQ